MLTLKPKGVIPAVAESQATLDQPTNMSGLEPSPLEVLQLGCDCGGTTGNRSSGEEGQRIWNMHQFTKGHKQWLEKGVAKIKKGQGFTGSTSRALRQHLQEMAKLLKDQKRKSFKPTKL